MVSHLLCLWVMVVQNYTQPALCDHKGETSRMQYFPLEGICHLVLFRCILYILLLFHRLTRWIYWTCHTSKIYVSWGLAIVFNGPLFPRPHSLKNVFTCKCKQKRPCSMLLCWISLHSLGKVMGRWIDTWGQFGKKNQGSSQSAAKCRFRIWKKKCVTSRHAHHRQTYSECVRYQIVPEISCFFQAFINS